MPHRRKSEQSLKASMGIQPPGSGENTTQEVRFKAKNSEGITEGTRVVRWSRGS